MVVGASKQGEKARGQSGMAELKASLLRLEYHNYFFRAKTCRPENQNNWQMDRHPISLSKEVGKQFPSYE